MKIAVAMATSRVGREILNILDERDLPVQEVAVLDAKELEGQEISFGKSKILQTQSLDDHDFAGTDIAFFAAQEKISAIYAKTAAQSGCIAIDSSSYFSAQEDVPLIIPEVNSHSAIRHKNIIASPGCLAIQILTALKSLHDIAIIRRLVASTYQSVSDLAKEGMDELYDQTKAMYTNQPVSEKIFGRRIAFNCIPQVGEFMEDGHTKAEWRMGAEIQKILGQDVKINVTCVYVPVFVGNAVSVSVEFQNRITEQDVFYALSKAPGVVIADKRQDGGYATPIDCVGEYPVYVSRIRADPTAENSINMWVVTDNLYKGAALNMVQIAELLTGNIA
ncbi:aspartate-semialdehyde dehydrogenase [Rickettsiales bacterium]|nr:aspartate-semialdehyde dehydrogenase [Rickettsiales bacterium]